MAVCPYCESIIAEDNKSLKLLALTEAVAKMPGSWTKLESTYNGYTFSAGRFDAVVREIKNNPGYPKNTYDDTYEQGSTYEAHIIVEIGGIFYKKTGTGDSYGEINWDGPVTEVKMTEKIVQVFE